MSGVTTAGAWGASFYIHPFLACPCKFFEAVHKISNRTYLKLPVIKLDLRQLKLVTGDIKMKAIVALIMLLGMASAQAHDALVVIGQSNAGGIAKYGKLDVKMGVKIINCTKGGTEIAKFLPNYDVTSIYGSCMAKINLVVSQGYRVKGIVFAQGERDATRLKEADGKTPVVTNWLPRVTHLLRSLRDDIGRNVPIVVWVMNSLPHSEIFPYWASIRNYQIRLSLPNAYKVDSNDYAFSMDKAYPMDSVHLTLDGYDNIGTRIAEIFSGAH